VTECRLASLLFSVIFIIVDDIDVAVKTVADLYHVQIACAVADMLSAYFVLII